MAQNKLQKDSDERAQLDLHINLLAEREATLVLKKLAQIEFHMGISVSELEKQSVAELIEETSPTAMVESIRKSQKD